MSDLYRNVLSKSVHSPKNQNLFNIEEEAQPQYLKVGFHFKMLLFSHLEMYGTKVQ